MAETTRPATRTQKVTGVLRIARSTDGLAFTDTDTVFLENASAPSLVRLPNEHLLAIFDQAAGASGNATVMAVSRSSDEGRSWSRPRPVRFVGSGAPAIRCGHGAFAIMPNGLLRLYFLALGPEKDGRRERSGERRESDSCAVLSAVSRNGLAYELDREVRIPLDGGWDVHPTVAQIGKRIDLHVDEFDEAGRVERGRAGVVLRLTSEDGRQLRPTAPLRTSGVHFVGSVIPVGKRFRAYVTGYGGIGSMVSDDGAAWRVENGVRLEGAFDPAVVQLKDETLLMLYCALSDERSRGRPQLALASSTHESNPNASGAGRSESSGSSAAPGDGESLAAGGTGPEASGAGDGDAGSGSGGSSASGEWESFASESAETTRLSPGDGGSINGFAGPTAPSGTSGSAEVNSESGQVAPVEGDPFPAKPNFTNPVDYHAWLAQLFPPYAENNAYDAFMVMAPHASPFGGERPAWWPESINDMFNGSYTGLIGPWLPSDHPDWEATHQLMEVGLNQFREVARLPNYACPYVVSPNSPGGPDGHHLIAELLLPSLAANRTLVKATLADAWRAENGQVSPERMTDAFETCLRNASQMGQGFTLIHRLVGMAEKVLTEENARAALANNVYQTPEQLESAFNTLRLYDQPPGDPARWLALEHASNMDVLQYLFSPAGPDGQPRLNVERAKYAIGQYSNGQVTDEDLNQAAQITSEELQAAVETLDTHYRELAEKWRIGYPQVREDEIGELENARANTNSITRLLLPSLSRAYQLMARNETSRRGTQLTYAVHLFKARNGRWPATLDELPPEYGDTMKTDPFTGGQFGYRVNENGATIYSRSNNGVDDGGVHSKRWGDDKKSDADSDDYVFWPPQN